LNTYSRNGDKAKIRKEQKQLMMMTKMRPRKTQECKERKKETQKRTREETLEAHRKEEQERTENNNLQETKRSRLNDQTEKQQRRETKPNDHNAREQQTGKPIEENEKREAYEQKPRDDLRREEERGGERGEGKEQETTNEEQTRDQREQEEEHDAKHLPDTLANSWGEFIEEEELQHMQKIKKERIEAKEEENRKLNGKNPANQLEKQASWSKNEQLKPTAAADDDQDIRRKTQTPIRKGGKYNKQIPRKREKKNTYRTR